MTPFRIGFGYDVHQLKEGYEFWLGGIKVDHVKGAVGHSDADVLIHVICDALLGAANMRNIGYHFSDQDPQYKGIDSKILLRRVHDLVVQKGYGIVNIDATVILETPKVNPHIENMQAVLTDILGLEMEELSIKATTHEKVDSFGEKRAIKAYAAALLYQL